MQDPRVNALARQLVRYSTRLRRHDRVLIDLYEVPAEVGVALIRESRAVNAIPVIQETSMAIQREMCRGATDPQFKLLGKHRLALTKEVDAYIAIRGSHNIAETSDVGPDQMGVVEKHFKRSLDWRISKTRWCVLRWPHPAMAQLAGMSTEAFEDFYFKVCLLDYRRLRTPMQALKRLMDRTKAVHIKGPGTDLRFSLEGMKGIVCCGEYNLPDGEVFTAPRRDSVEGKITYNVPSIYNGVSFDQVCFEFKKGHITQADASNRKALNAILDRDAGARFIGEFAIGVNPLIREPMRDILFDEKIAGSFHLTPGQAYEEADNGNRSKVHWDLVCIQRSDYGGGEILFDGKLVRKNGRFIPRSLELLNKR